MNILPKKVFFQSPQITYNLFLCFHGYAHVVYSHVQDLTRDTYYETGDPPRLPAQLEGRWGQWN
jgi:hypothetical protein